VELIRVVEHANSKTPLIMAAPPVGDGNEPQSDADRGQDAKHQ